MKWINDHITIIGLFVASSPLLGGCLLLAYMLYIRDREFWRTTRNNHKTKKTS